MAGNEGECKYTPGIGCTNPDKCGKCGWNPAEIARRKQIRRDEREARIAAKVGHVVLTNQERVALIVLLQDEINQKQLEADEASFLDTMISNGLINYKAAREYINRNSVTEKTERKEQNERIF